MSKSLEEKIIKEFTKKYESFELGEPVNIKQYRLLKSFIKKTLAQYKREIRNKIEKKKQYHLSTSYRCKNDRTYGEEGKFCVECGKKITEKEELKWESLGEEGFNKAIDDVLAELDKLNHTDKKEGGK